MDHGRRGHLGEVHEPVLYGVPLREDVPVRTGAVDDHHGATGLRYLAAKSRSLLLVELLVLRLVGYDAPAKLDQYHRATQVLVVLYGWREGFTHSQPSESGRS